MIMYLRGNFAGQASLRRIKETHSRSKLDIEAHFYQLWKTALLKTIPLHDQKYAPGIGAAWNKYWKWVSNVLSKGIVQG